MPKHILIVEDEDALLNVLSAKLKREGYEVSEAHDGEEAIASMRKKLPDVVLLDIVMPKMNGFDVLETMQSEQALSRVPVIVISNSGQPVEIERAKSLGAVDYLVKAQFDPDEVIEKVRKYLSTRSAPETNAAQNTQTGAGGTIVVVEDDKFLRDLLVQKLKKEGLTVSEAIDGDEGLRKIQEEKPVLVLLDLILPGLDGFEVLKRMKESSQTAKIPVIILSNLGQKEDVERGLKLGAQDFLIKAHFTPGEIITKVKNLMQ